MYLVNSGLLLEIFTRYKHYHKVNSVDMTTLRNGKPPNCTTEVTDFQD